jgi:hypothetical protein
MPEHVGLLKYLACQRVQGGEQSAAEEDALTTDTAHPRQQCTKPMQTQYQYSDGSCRARGQVDHWISVHPCREAWSERQARLCPAWLSIQSSAHRPVYIERRNGQTICFVFYASL